MLNKNSGAHQKISKDKHFMDQKIFPYDRKETLKYAALIPSNIENIINFI